MGSAEIQIGHVREAQLSMRALCCYVRFSVLLSFCALVMGRSWLAAVSREVSLWSCGRTARRQTSSITCPRGV